MCVYVYIRHRAFRHAVACGFSLAVLTLQDSHAGRLRKVTKVTSMGGTYRLQLLRLAPLFLPTGRKNAMKFAVLKKRAPRGPGCAKVRSKTAQGAQPDAKSSVLGASGVTFSAKIGDSGPLQNMCFLLCFCYI